MNHQNERLQAQHLAEQLLQGQAPGSMVSYQMPGMNPHVGTGNDAHPHGSHINVGYVRGDGSVYGGMIQPG